MDELDDAKKELANATVRFEKGTFEWKAYTQQLNELNAKLNRSEPQNIFLVEQIKILSQAPMPDPLDFNTKKILFEQKMKKRKSKQREQIQNELLALMPLNFYESINFKNGE